ncbi:scopoletin glucosyltransferase-like [Olea europaea subsp. europaea]|uniref:Glycosyltransferase n=1 Tax=Olea europaea subsp. europaea TaxID=158383 RepID=A0A8S0U8Q4_OLEEU|nr:scopoletin glucosyltransferase-like [Olea europaea subsp. europaea]
MNQLHVFFLPYLAYGHMIPTLETAKLFASRGVQTTMIVTPGFVEPVEKARKSGFNIGIHVMKFPPEESGLPHGITSDQISDDMLPKFLKSMDLLQEPLEKLLEEFRPDCLVADVLFPWATDAAAKFDIPRLIFHGTSFLALCASEHMRIYKPYKNVSSDLEEFVLPNLPHQLKFTGTQVPNFYREEIENELTKLLTKIKESEIRSYGVLFNSFYELEPDYADHYRKVLRRNSWHIGPLLLCNKGGEDYKAQRGKESAIDEHECLEWLNSKEPNSVVYICFGSIATFTTKQLHEIAKGLEISSQKFIWVVRKGKNQKEDGKENWLPEGFEERTKDKGLIIRGWAPQLLILENKATGVFVTHCGWNSMLEGVCSGVPMVTWPVFAEQFYNEKLVTDVLRIGVSVGNKQYKRKESEGIEREAIDMAIRRIMEGEEGSEMRSRAQEYKEKARKAVEEDGSSYTDLSALLEELRAYRLGVNTTKVNNCSI